MSFTGGELLAEESGAELLYQKRSSTFAAGKYAKAAIGAVMLVSAGYIGGRHTSAQSLYMSGLQTKPMYSINQFTTQFGTWSTGLTCPTLTNYISQIANNENIAPANAQATDFKTWYTGILATEKSEADAIMNTKMNGACAPAATTAAPAKGAPAAPVMSTCLAIADYAAFGHCFSVATAGHPWSYILQVEAEVVAVSTSSLSAQVGALQNFYHKKASDSERKAFDESALVHMKAHRT